MDLLQTVDAYCERTGPEFWSEPFNAVSNLAFIFAGILILNLADKDRALRGFGWLVVVVGIGSAMFHTLATIWAKFADVIPISICLAWYVWSYLRYAAKFSWPKTWACLLSFGVVSGALAAIKMPAWMNESHQYFGALIALFLLAAVRPEARRPFLAAGLVFTGSLIFRTVDLQICDGWPLGTHFLWHTLNGVAFYFAAQAYVASARKIR